MGLRTIVYDCQVSLERGTETQAFAWVFIVPLDLKLYEKRGDVAFGATCK